MLMIKKEICKIYQLQPKVKWQSVRSLLALYTKSKLPSLAALREKEEEEEEEGGD